MKSIEIHSIDIDYMNAVRCSVLECVGVSCSVLQCVAVCCSVLQCVAVCCSVLQCAAVCCSVLQRVAACYSVLHCVAVCCSVLRSDRHFELMCDRRLLICDCRLLTCDCRQHEIEQVPNRCDSNPKPCQIDEIANHCDYLKFGMRQHVLNLHRLNRCY